MDRISYKLVKRWLTESSFAQEQGLTINSWNGYYHILQNGNSLLFSATTPGKLWEMFGIYRSGYYRCMEEKPKCSSCHYNIDGWCDSHACECLNVLRCSDYKMSNNI